MIQRDLHAKLLGYTNGSHNIIRAMRMRLERDLPAHDRQKRLHLHIKRTLLILILFRRVHFFHVALRLFQIFTQQGRRHHAGDRRFFAILTVCPLGIFTKGDLHGNRLLDEHIVHAIAVQLHRAECAANHVCRTRARDSRRHAAAQRISKGLVQRIDAVNGAYLRRHRITVFVGIVAFPARGFFMHADMAVTIHKTRRHQHSLRINDLHIRRRVHMLANGNDFSLVNQYFAASDIRRSNRSNMTVSDQQHLYFSFSPVGYSSISSTYASIRLVVFLRLSMCVRSRP